MMTIKLGKCIGGIVMDKEKILAKSREDNSYLDEMQQSEIRNGFGFGGVVVAILCFVFSAIKALQGQRFFEFIVILFGYMSATSLYSFAKAKKKSFLIRGAACGIVTVIGFAAYFFI
jgi:hypothetical protein